MPPKLGIDNIKVLVLALIGFGNVVDQVLLAPSVPEKIADALKLFNEAMTLPGLNLQAALDEVKDLDESEQADLLAAIKAKFDIQDKKLEAVIEGAFSVGFHLEAIVKECADLVALAKAPAPQA